MFTDLKPYPAYADSGSQWFRRLPVSWEVSRLRGVSRLLVSNVDKLTHDHESPVRLCNYVDVYKNEFITDRPGYMTASASADEIRRFRVRVDDVAITKDSESWTDIGVPAYVAQEADDLVCGYHLGLLRTHKDRLSGAFLFRALLVPAIATQFHLAAGGVTRYGLSQDDIRSARVPIPSLTEQAAIVKYLGHANARIDRAIAAKRKLIALLEEQKQAVINQAVTRGLDPNVPLKDSGIPWLGLVPAHWQAIALRRAWEVIDCKHLTVPYLDDGYPLASVVQAQRFFLDLSDARRTGRDHYSSLIEGARRPQKGDLVYCRNVGVGSAAVVTGDETFAMGQDVCLLRSAVQDSIFMNHFLRSRPMSIQLDRLLVGSTFRRINISQIRALVILVPPLTEQHEIVRRIESETESLDAVARRSTREIELLREFRTRLTADVVTGQIDIRDAAARLPELDPADLVSDVGTDEDDFDAVLAASLEEVDA